MRKINKVIIHMTETPSNMDIGVEEIRGWHLERGFNDVGYHYVIRRDGTVEYGRDLDVVGAHCRGQNADSIGIAYVGGLHGDDRTDLQTEAMHKLVQGLVFALGDLKIHGHDEFSDKACPNFSVQTEFSYINIASC